VFRIDRFMCSRQGYLKSFWQQGRNARHRLWPRAGQPPAPAPGFPADIDSLAP